MSKRPGSTVIPSVLITLVPEGTATSLRGPTATMRSPAISTTPFSMGGPP
jgi:hypothetical protein